MHAVEGGEPFVGCWERGGVRWIGVYGVEESEGGAEFPCGYSEYWFAWLFGGETLT
jgi:hypothetical protein